MRNNMKKMVIFLCLAAMLVSVFAACGKKETKSDEGNSQTQVVKEEEPKAEEPAEEPKAEEPAEEPKTEEPAEEPKENEEYKEIYKPIIDRAVYILTEADFAEEEQNEGETALFESILNREYAAFGDPLFDFGFTYRDLNSDGVYELLIMYNYFKDEAAETGDYTGNGASIAAAYTIKDGEPKLICEGWSRNTNNLRADNKIVNRGSAGAIYSISGLYEVTPEGDFKCLDYYFTHEIGDDYENIGCYHNNTGIGEVEGSELIEGGFDKYEELSSALYGEMVELKITTFAAYHDSSLVPNIIPYDESDLSGYIKATLLEVGTDPTGYKQVILDDSEYQVPVLLEVCDGTVYNVKFKALSLKDYDEEYNTPIFDETVMYEQDKYAVGDEPIIAYMSFPGDTPSYGISYELNDGFEFRLAFSLSGLDGSLVTTPY